MTPRGAGATPEVKLVNPARLAVGVVFPEAPSCWHE